MKKASVILCLILFACILVSCGKASAAAETTAASDIDPVIIGTWKYDSYSEYREYITTLITDPDVYYSVYYVFNSDGSGETYMSTSSSKRSFTYSFIGTTLTITSDDGNSFDTVCRVKGDSLTIHDDENNQDLVFERQ